MAQLRQPLQQAACLLLALSAYVTVAAATAVTSDAASRPSGASTAVLLSSTSALERFTFGSCNKQEKPQPMWHHMLARSPQMFIWLGDVIYADKAPVEFVRRPSSLTTMAAMYRAQYTLPEYALMRESTRIVGIYDDHDYGENDGHGGYPDKEPARQLFLDFIDESPSSPRRYRDGVYADYLWGVPGSGRRVKLILLDARYNQDPVEDDMLGDAQWTWLANAIDSDDDVQLFLLGTGVQLVSTDKRIGEGWRLKPKSRARVFDLFARRTRNRDASVLFMSGDVHMAEADVTYVCTQDAASTASSAVTVTPVYELTSSGLTHSVGSQVSETIAEIVLPFILDERESFAETLNANHSIRGYYSGLNFGYVEIEWESRRVLVQMVDVVGQPALNYTLPFEALSQSTYKSNMGVPPLIAARCASEAARELTPAMWVIPGVKFMIMTIILSQVGLAVVVAGLWHWFATRADWKIKTRAARDTFKIALKEKQAKLAAKKLKAKTT